MSTNLLLSMPDAIFSLINRNFDSVQDILNLESAHPILKAKLMRTFWCTSHALHINVSLSKTQQYKKKNEIDVNLITFNNEKINLIKSIGFNAFCDVDNHLTTPSCSNIEYNCKEILRKTKNLNELYIGPFDGSLKALFRLLYDMNRLGIELRKIVLIYAFPEFFRSMYSTELDARNGFPSKTAHSKFVKFIQSQRSSLESFKLFIDENCQKWISIERTNLRLLVEYNCECNMSFKQALYPLLSAFSYDNRPKPTRCMFKITVSGKSLLSAIDYCISTVIPFRCHSAMAHLSFEISIPNEKEETMAEIEKSRFNAAQLVLMTDDLIPRTMRQLITIEWNFVDLNVTHNEFQLLCASSKPFKNAVTTVRTNDLKTVIANVVSTTTITHKK